MKIKFKLLSLVIGCFLAIILGETAFTLYSYVRYKTISVEELLDREKSNAYVLEFFKDNNTYLESLFPHPYLAFVHRKLGYEWVNNIGLEGRDFPVEKDKSKFTILVTGGSVANYFAQWIKGKENYFEDILNSRYDFEGKQVVVLSGASGAWKQPHQAIMFLLYSELVDGIITLDGFNEHYMLKPEVSVRIEYPANAFHQLNPIIEEGAEKLAIAYITSTLYGYSRSCWLIRHSRLLYFSTRFLRNRLQGWGDEKLNDIPGEQTGLTSIFALPREWSPEKKSSFNMELYKKYIRLMAGMARQMNLKQAFFIQPVPAIGKTLTEEERAVVGDLSYRDLYQNMTNKLLALREEQIPVYSLLDVFVDCEESIYRDPCHFIESGPRRETKGNRLIAERIASLLEEEWDLKRMTK